MAGLPKGQVRNLINLPANYGKRINVGGIRSTYKPSLEVSVYKDRYGRYTVVEKGHRLTAEEKRLGLKRTRSLEARFIKERFETYGPDITLRKAPSKRMGETRRLKVWEVNGQKGWVDVKKGEFIGVEMPGVTGDMERMMRSFDRTTFGLGTDSNFEGRYRNLNARQKLEMIELISELDLDTFFREYIDSDGSFEREVNEAKQEEGLEIIESFFRQVTGE